MEDIKNYTLDELKEFLTTKGYHQFYAKQIFSWLYKKRLEDFDEMTNISKEGRRFLKENFYFSQLKLLKREISRDGTEKFLFNLPDNSGIETVFIPEEKRRTLCLSTQVGCRFNCKFCLSGQGGFKRNLTVSEIINQYLAVADLIAPDKITNVVFMGIGEPLDNFEHTLKAIEIFMEPLGIYLGKRKICISTCGLIPQIKKLSDLKLGIKLSLSLHSPDDNIRTQIMPVNKKHPLGEVIKAIRSFSNQKYPITFEYILIKGLNTRKEDTLELAKLLRGINYIINLIPYNAPASLKPGFLKEPGFRELKPPLPEEVDNFKEELIKKGIFASVRKSRGEDINAACGQLRALWKGNGSIY
ncbi:MAG: 23S rRNA (adenine(2503)-C(2))-methyltransferase RlmN [bacterium]|nr:23S rRNA (adenine(2503)-C(2))-methyltransferase RlmN [bacterium]